jgi:hypothetical protein
VRLALIRAASIGAGIGSNDANTTQIQSLTLEHLETLAPWRVPTPMPLPSSPMPPTDEARQRAYYQATAASYHECHVGEQGEHDLALDLLVMLARRQGVSGSFLDVGAGTGRAMRALATAFPQARV